MADFSMGVACVTVVDSFVTHTQCRPEDFIEGVAILEGCLLS